MMILKAKDLVTSAQVANFVRENNIQRENIVAITRSERSVTNSQEFSIFFYGDPEIKEKTPSSLV